MEPTTDQLIILNYSEYPGPRYCDQGDSSGEDFYHEILNPTFSNALKNNHKLVVTLDGTAGYASSFLDEAFGNLVYDFTEGKVKTNIEIISNQEPDWKEMLIMKIYPDWERRRLDKKLPKKTTNHSAWFRLDDGNIIKKVWISL